MVAHTTSDYSTGWMPGDIKGAWLASTDDTDLVGTTPLEDDFSSYADTAAMEAAGWVSTASTGTGDISLVSGAMQLDGDTTDNRARAYQILTTVIGAVYTVQYSSTDNHHFRVGEGLNGAQNLNLLNQPSGANNFAYNFVATVTTSYVTWEGFNPVGSEPQIDNISIKLADADRSVNANGLIVNGTVTKTAVATGSELVAYSGFSTSNYLEQPYNAALDFGTGDFCIKGWVKHTGASSSTILHRALLSLNGGILLQTTATDVVLYASANTTFTFIMSAPLLVNTFAQVAVVRRSGKVFLYINGTLATSATLTTDLTYTDAILNFGLRTNNTSPNVGSMALWRASATAPTDEQMRKIYNDEKWMFQEGAQVTLNGSSDAVTALAHDKVTDLLHVGTSGGMSVFDGLVRVSEDATAVTTSISANDGRIVRQ